MLNEGSITEKQCQCGVGVTGGAAKPWCMVLADGGLCCGVCAGSGLFTPEGPAAYHYDSDTEEGRLLLAELSTHPRLSPAYPPAINWSSYATSIKNFPGENDTFSGAVRRDIFTFSELRHKDGNCTVCQGDLCCHLVYQMLTKRNDEVYVLGAFDGLHGSVIKYHWQVIPFSEASVATCQPPENICFHYCILGTLLAVKSSL